MAKKILPSGLKLNGIAPNILLKNVESTAPFIFQGEIDLTGDNKKFLARLAFYKKNLKTLNNINLTDYFYLCMSAHWATAGTFVPTDVDNQIREGLWRHETVGAHLQMMTKITIDSWKWDYQDVTNRKSYNPLNGQVMSTHEGTWLSVAIGGYNALIKNQQPKLADQIKEVILEEVLKEQNLLLELRENRDHINFLRSTALMAHNFGDLDRVMDQWKMNPDSDFYKQIYKLGHQLNQNYNKIFVYAGQVNKHFLAQENHRHMSMRQPRGLRKSHKFLIPVGPFMDNWGQNIAESKLLTMVEKAEIVCALLEGYKRQNLAFGYTRAMHGMMKVFKNFDVFQTSMSFDFIEDLKQSQFYRTSEISTEEFEAEFIKKFEKFICPITDIQF